MDFSFFFLFLELIANALAEILDIQERNENILNSISKVLFYKKTSFILIMNTLKKQVKKFKEQNYHIDFMSVM